MSSQTAPSPAANQPAPSPSRPSSSVLLISSRNEVLLLHRVRSSNNFPSAHVFPGGNLDAFHDGEIPEPNDLARHEDGPAYRRAAIRETFEESGILLARKNGFGRLVEIDEAEREEGRKLVQKGEVPFEQWLARKGGRADADGLIPFTRWITPTHTPKRYTTQMYLYFLPLATSSTSISQIGAPDATRETIIPDPTSDGGVEHTAARFLPASDWIAMQDSGELMLFPPQLYLLRLLAHQSFFSSTGPDVSVDTLGLQRERLKDFLRDDEEDPLWSKKCIGPYMIARSKRDGRTVLGLDKPGWELKNSDRAGDRQRAVLVDFTKEGPRRVEVRWKEELLEEERRLQQEDREKGEEKL